MSIKRIVHRVWKKANLRNPIRKKTKLSMVCSQTNCKKHGLKSRHEDQNGNRDYNFEIEEVSLSVCLFIQGRSHQLPKVMDLTLKKRRSTTIIEKAVFNSHLFRFKYKGKAWLSVTWLNHLGWLSLEGFEVSIENKDSKNRVGHSICMWVDWMDEMRKDEYLKASQRKLVRWWVYWEWIGQDCPKFWR